MAPKPKRLSDLHVLVVDDEADICQMVKYALESMGIGRVHCAGNGQDAWNLFYEAKHRFDMVVSDWMMPQMTGLDLLRRIRKHGSTVPFLMLTVNVSRESVAEASKAGVTGYVAKPFDLQGLQAHIRKLARKILAETDAG